MNRIKTCTECGVNGYTEGCLTCEQLTNIEHHLQDKSLHVVLWQDKRKLYDLCEHPDVATAYAQFAQLNGYGVTLERLRVTLHEHLIDLVRDALPSVPDVDALCHRGICEQSHCRYCTRIRGAHAALNLLERHVPENVDKFRELLTDPTSRRLLDTQRRPRRRG